MNQSRNPLHKVPHEVLHEVFKPRLLTEFSKLRQGNSNELMHELIDFVVDKYRPVATCYALKVDSFITKQQLSPNSCVATLNEVRQVMVLKREMTSVRGPCVEVKALPAGGLIAAISFLVNSMLGMFVHLICA